MNSQFVPASTEPVDQLLTLTEVARIFKLRDPGTVRKWIRRGLIPGIAVGRLTRVWKSDVDSLIERGTIQGK